MKVEVNGKTYCVETLIDDNARLRKEIIESAKTNRLVLDSVRAEINQYGSIWVQYTIKGHTDKDIDDIIEDVLKQAKQQVLAVIDKHIREDGE